MNTTLELPPTDRDTGSRLRLLAAGALAILALLDLAIFALLSRGIDQSLALGPLRLSVHRFDRPLIIGLGLSACLWFEQRRNLRWRRFAVTLIALFGLLAIVNYARQTPPITAVSDIAVTELYTLLAAEGKLVVGPYSRFGWHHPGPLYFWLQAPFYLLSGYRTASLYSGALAINITALVTLVWVLARNGRGLLPALVTGAFVAFAWRVPTLMATPWTAHVPVLSSLTFVVLCAAVGSGRLRLLPLAILFGSFVTQTHLAFVPLVALLSALALAATIYQKTTSPGSDPVWPVFHASAWLLLALWLFPIAEQLSHTPGNMTEIWRFFLASSRPGPAAETAFIDWAYMLVGIFRVEELPSMGHFTPSHLGWGVPLAAAEVLLLPVVAVWALRVRERFTASLALMTLAASVAGLWSITRIRDDVLAYEIFWLAGVGAVNVAVIVAAALEALRRRLVFDGVPSLAGALCAAILLAGIVVGVRDLRHVAALELGRHREADTVAAMQRSIREYLDADRLRKPLFRIESPLWDFAGATFVRLHQAGIPFSVQDGWLPMFTTTFAVSGGEDAVITIANPGSHQALNRRPGNVTILESPPVYLDAIRVQADPYR